MTSGKWLGLGALALLGLAGCAQDGPNQPRFSDQAVVFREVDSNQNGFITRDEFENSPLDQRWEQIDTNGDGIVDLEEYRDAYGPSALNLNEP